MPNGCRDWLWDPNRAHPPGSATMVLTPDCQRCGVPQDRIPDEWRRLFPRPNQTASLCQSCCYGPAVLFSAQHTALDGERLAKHIANRIGGEVWHSDTNGGTTIVVKAGFMAETTAVR